MDITEVLAQLENVETLSRDELKKLDGELVALYEAIIAGEIEGVESDDVEKIEALADATQTVRARDEALKAEAEEKQAKIAQLATLIKAGDEEVEEEATEETEEVVEAPAEVVEETVLVEAVVEETPEVKPQPLKALAASTRHMPVIQVKEESHGAFYDSQGKEIDFDGFAKELINKRLKFNNNTPRDVEERITVGTIKSDFASEQMLDGEDAVKNTKRVKELQKELMRPQNWSNGELTASGGWVAPYQTIYPIEVIAGAQRPVRDALPRFGVDRGGVRFRRGLSYATLQGISSTGTWTNTTDITPASSTKNTGTITSDTIQEVALSAVYRQLKFGNFRERADAEGVAAWMEGTAAVWAGQAETNLLDALSTASTAVSTDPHLGFARDFLHQLSRAGAVYRNSNRLDRDAMLRIIIPSWLPDAVITDWMESSSVENEFVTYSTADFEAMCHARNFNVSYYADSPTSDNQQYTNQIATDLYGWKSSAKWFLFHEGAHLFLDGGTLDLGLVRDSTLNGTNDVKTFAENFENLAYVGVNSWKLTSTVQVNGTAALPKDNSAQAVS